MSTDPRPYQRSPSKLLIKKGVRLSVTKEGLAGRSIAVERMCPTWQSEEANFLRRTFGDEVRIKAYDAIPKCPKSGAVSLDDYQPTLERQLADLAAGRIDAIFANKLSLYFGVIDTPRGNSFELTGPDFYDVFEGAGIAVRKHEPKLLGAFNAAIAAILEDGTYQHIRTKYLPFDIYGD